MGELKEELWAIVIVSSAMKGLPPEEIEQFLIEGRKDRMAKNVTGVVLMTPGNVFVLEEGPKELVKQTFQAAKQHPTHHSIIKLYDGPIESRLFEDFPLAFKPIGHPILSHLNDFKSEEMKEYLNETLSLDTLVSRLIKDFIRNNT